MLLLTFSALTQIERFQASTYHPKVSRALQLGWLLDYQERSEVEYDELIETLERPQGRIGQALRLSN